MAYVDITGFERARRMQAEQKAVQDAELMQVSKEADVIEQTDEQQNVVVENVEQSAVEVEPPVDIDALTKNQIMAELDKREITYNPRDNKDTLKGLLLDAIK